MKRLILLLLCLFILFDVVLFATSIYLEKYAYFEDNDPGYINIKLSRKVFITIDKEPEQIGDEVTLIAVLMDFKSKDNISFQWAYTTEITEKTTWHLIENATQQTYTFVLDETNINYWYCVIVKWEGAI